MEAGSFKSRLGILKKTFETACTAFECIVQRDSEEGSAKRKLDVVMEQLLSMKSMLKEKTESIDFRYSSYENRLSEYEVTFGSLMNTLANQIEDLKNDSLQNIEEGLKNVMDVAKENQELKVLLKREREEAMHQQQIHNFTTTEKNTILATCRKLEEQLEEKNTQIQQLQRESTVTLWKREKTKILDDIKSNEKDLAKRLSNSQVEAIETKDRLQRRITELTDQIKFLKLEKELGGKLSTNLGFQSGTSTVNDEDTSKQQLYRKERSLVIAEAEIQKQQKYFIGFINGLKRDFKIMLERQGIKLESYSRDQKAYVNMLNRLHTASKEGMLSDLKAKVPSHYQGVAQETLGHPLGKRLTRSMSELHKEYCELQKTGEMNDPLLMKPTIKNWRNAKSPNGVSSEEVYGIHPELIDKKSGKLLVNEAMKLFPEWNERDITEMFEQFQNFDINKDFSLDSQELLEAIPGILGRMTTTEEIQEAMNEIDTDKSGTVDFFEFLCVARLTTQGKGKSGIFKKKKLTALQKSPQIGSKVCVIQ